MAALVPGLLGGARTEGRPPMTQPTLPGLVVAEPLRRIEFRVPAVPVAQPRPRAVLAHGGMGARVHEVTHVKNKATGERKPHPIAAFKATVRQAAEAAHRGPPLEGPLRLSLLFLMPRPKSMCWKKRPTPRAFHECKPDADNLAKSVKDALSGLVWRDDAQVAWLVARKLYASGSEQPGVLCEIRQVAEGEAA